MIKKILSTISLILILLPQATFAEETQFELTPLGKTIFEQWKYVEEAGDCALQAFNSLDNFFISAINPEKARWTFLIPLYPECVARDVLAIGDQMERIGSEIRASAFSCQNERVENLQERYFKLAAEQTYLFALFEIDVTKPAFFLSGNVQGLTGGGDLEDGNRGWAMRSAADVKKKVLDEHLFFGKTDQEKEQLYQEIVDKYADKIADYKTCATQGVEDLVKKIEEFKERLGGFDVLVEEVSRQKALLQKIPFYDLENDKPTPKEENPANVDIEYLVAPGAVGDLVSSFVSVKVNGLTPTAASKQILDEAKKGFKNPAGMALISTFSAFSNQQRVITKNYEDIDEINRYFLELEEGSDYIQREFKKVIDSKNPGDKSLNYLLETTINVQLNSLVDCTAKIEEKQCRDN